MMFLLVLFIVVFPLVAQATTWNAADCEEGTIQTLHDSASVVDGDTIAIPAGTCTWTTLVATTKGITLQGAGIGNTIVRDGITSGALLTVTLKANLTTRVTGIEFNNNGRVSANLTGIIQIIGATGATVDNRRFRFDHNKLDHLNGFMVRFIRVYGVMDNNTVLPASGIIPLYMFTQDAAYTDARWSESLNLGQENFVFIEDNTITRDSGSTFACLDAYGGARIVFRYNTLTRCYIGMHGTESAGRWRGGTAMEVYGNVFDNTSGTAVANFSSYRSGTGVVYNNTVNNWASITSSVGLNNERTDNDFDTFGIADGRNPWDNNDTANNPHVTGTVSSSGSLTMTDLAKSWTTNQWTGYVLRKTTAPCNVSISAVDAATDRFTVTGHAFQTGDSVFVMGHTGSTPLVQGLYTVTVVDANTVTLGGVNVTSAGSGGYMSLSVRSSTSQPVCSAPIVSNTATALTYTASFNGGSQNLTFAANDTYEINKIIAVFDQPGIHGGTSLAGVTNPVPGTYDQSVDPIYEWNNVTGGGTNLDVAVSSQWGTVMILQNTHYFNDTQKPGYTAYTYPHPLQGATSTPRRFAPAFNLR